MTAYVFLGPSLPRAHAARILDATYLPPIQQGDLVRLLERAPRHVGIVDGYFETVPAVWHKEILLALSRGVRVFGAASMGALRAAELHAYGMVGVGTIFEWFRDGTVVADDEVAVHHGPAELGYLPLSRALVDIRHGCARAVSEGILDPALAESIVAAARALPYWERTCEAVSARLEDAGCDAGALAGWRAFMEARCDSLKARDAEALLATMRAAIAGPDEPTAPGFTLAETVFLDRLRNAQALESALRSDGPAPADAPDLDARRRAVLLRIAAREAAEAAGWEVSAQALREEAAHLCLRLGLRDGEDLRARLISAGLDEAALWAHLRDELFVRRLMRRWDCAIDRALPQEIRLAEALRSPTR